MTQIRRLKTSTFFPSNNIYNNPGTAMPKSLLKKWKDAILTISVSLCLTVFALHSEFILVKWLFCRMYKAGRGFSNSWK